MVDAAKASTDILKNKFKNKVVLIKGKKSIKIKNLLNDLKKIIKVKSSPIFLNKRKRVIMIESLGRLKYSKSIDFYRHDALNYKKA